jgi:hypothetical protein
MVFRDRYGCWGFLDLWRAATATPFTSHEADVLSSIGDAVTTALRRGQANTFVVNPTREPRRPGSRALGT